jgi:hypothetical protein
VSGFLIECLDRLTKSSRPEPGLVLRIREAAKWLRWLKSDARTHFANAIVFDIVDRMTLFPGVSFEFSRRIAMLVVDELPEVMAYLFSVRDEFDKAGTTAADWRKEGCSNMRICALFRASKDNVFAWHTVLALPTCFGPLNEKFMAFWNGRDMGRRGCATQIDWCRERGTVRLKFSWPGNGDMSRTVPFALACILAHLHDKGKATTDELASCIPMDTKECSFYLSNIRKNDPELIIQKNDELAFNPNFSPQRRNCVLKSAPRLSQHWWRDLKTSDEPRQSLYRIIVYRFAKKQRRFTRQQASEELQDELGSRIDENVLTSVLDKLKVMDYLCSTPSEPNVYIFPGGK